MRHCHVGNARPRGVLLLYCDALTAAHVNRRDDDPGPHVDRHSATGHTHTQLWTDVTLTWIEIHSLTLRHDIEPKWLVSKSPDEPACSTLDLTRHG